MRPDRRAWIAAALLAGCLAGAAWIRLGPVEASLLDLDTSTSAVVVDRNGIPLYEALSGDGTRSARLTAGRLPSMLVRATVAVEDRRFWRHPGIDPIAIARAALQNLAGGRVAQGGSTISQQVAKLLLDRRRSEGATDVRRRGFTAKAEEAIIALRLEHRFTKHEILALYFNLAPYGNQLVGAAQASRVYFGRDPADLTVAQAAFLAGLPQRPTVFNPYRRPDAAAVRQRAVLGRMQAAGVLTAEEASHAAGERLTFTRDPAPFRAPHFVEMVLQDLGRHTSPLPRPAVVRTTLDAALQAEVQGIIRSHRAALTRHGAANVAVVVLDNERGEWLAWEGSGDYFDDTNGGRINGPRVPRQPGSALKPLTYALAFEEGLTPASVLPDIPSHFPTAEAGVLYSPRNYDGRYRGPLLARQALAGSENVPAVALASRIGAPRLLRFLTRSGLTTLTQSASYYGLGVTLGNAEVRLDELVAAYAAFARGGLWLAPSWQPAEARCRHLSDCEARRPVSPRTAYWIGDVLSDGRAREFIFGRGGALEFPFPAAVKTGTSQAYHDNWTVGYTRDVTVGVWVGNFDRKPLRQSSGVTGAAPIFHGVMLAAMARARGGIPLADAASIVPRPDGLDQGHVCTLSGMPANRWCPARVSEWLPRGDETPCTWHQQADGEAVVVWPAEYRQWALENGLAREQRAGGRQPAADGRQTAAMGTGRGGFTPPTQPVPAAPHVDARGTRSIAIANPPDGATYLIDPTLRREFQALPLRVVVPSTRRIAWTVNGRSVGSASSDTAFLWPLEPGTHRIEARDARGRTAETRITVR